MSSSKAATCCRSWVLIPQTRKSPGKGISRRTMTGRFLIRRSAWGTTAIATSPSFIVGVRLLDHVQRVFGLVVTIGFCKPLVGEDKEIFALGLERIGEDRLFHDCSRLSRLSPALPPS